MSKFIQSCENKDVEAVKKFLANLEKKLVEGLRIAVQGNNVEMTRHILDSITSRESIRPLLKIAKNEEIKSMLKKRVEFQHVVSLEKYNKVKNLLDDVLEDEDTTETFYLYCEDAEHQLLEALIEQKGYRFGQLIDGLTVAYNKQIAQVLLNGISKSDYDESATRLIRKLPEIDNKEVLEAIIEWSRKVRPNTTRQELWNALKKTDEVWIHKAVNKLYRTS